MTKNVPNVLNVVNVTRSYLMGDETVHALAGISFKVPQGDFWSIMGPSGSGKSTLLNIIGCLDKPTTGEYWLNGENVATMQDDLLSDHRLKNLGFIFQSFHLISQLTVLENIEVPMLYLGMSQAERRERAFVLAKKVGIDQRVNHLPMELSGGQRQRVAVARALANEPALLLADEPTGNLDTATSVQIMDLFHELHSQGKTIIIVTHEPEIAEHSHMRLVLKDGLIRDIQENPPCVH